MFRPFGDKTTVETLGYSQQLRLTPAFKPVNFAAEWTPAVSTAYDCGKLLETANFREGLDFQVEAIDLNRHWRFGEPPLPIGK